MNEDKNFLNLQALNSSLKTIENVDNYVNDMSLDNIMLEIKKDLKKINFEHGNCFTGYQGLIDNIMIELNDVKTDISSLSTSLNKTVESFDDFERTDFRKTTAANELKDSVGESNVTTIPPANSQTTTTIPEPEIEEKEPINTVPIGLGIAATGIAGSVGAVVLDSMHYSPNKQVEKYDDQPETVEKRQAPLMEDIAEKDDLDEDDFISSDHTFDDVTPYHATRDKKSMDKFYDE